MLSNSFFSYPKIKIQPIDCFVAIKVRYAPLFPIPGLETLFLNRCPPNTASTKPFSISLMASINEVSESLFFLCHRINWVFLYIFGRCIYFLIVCQNYNTNHSLSDRRLVAVFTSLITNQLVYMLRGMLKFQ